LKAKTQELLFLLLWSCEMLSRPSWRNLTESFEGWAYRNGFQRQLARLEKLQLVESRNSPANKRLHRLSARGRLLGLGGRDPTVCWQRVWDGRWRLVLFDVPVGQDSARNRLRESLCARGFGYLQNSVWITPDPLTNERQFLAGDAVDVETLILLEATPCSGESDAEIVAGAWNFDAINQNYANYLKVLEQRPNKRLDTEGRAKVFHHWVQQEHRAWQQAMSMDPLLPECLLPPGYLGRKAWCKRCRILVQAAEQMRTFKSPTHE
jgi:phenylacetic acid degradation operon negative regulatory protein